jgi:tetratricopeptide (TPR) repeat protein
VSAEHNPLSSTVAISALILVSVVAYLGSLSGGFVLDDTAFLPTNEKLAAVTNPLQFFTDRIWDYTRFDDPVPIYRPIATLVLWANFHLLGSTPLPWHLFSLLLHVGCVVLLFQLLINRDCGVQHRYAPLLAALIFALNPIHAPAVAWIMAFVHPLATLLALGALLLLHGEHSRWVSVTGYALLVSAAMFTVEVAIAVPLFVCLNDLLRKRRLNLAVWGLNTALVAIYMGARAAVLQHAIPLQLTPAGVATAIDFALAYARQLALPWPDKVYLSYPADGISSARDYVGVVILVAVIGWATVRGDNAARSGALWLVITLLPLLAAALSPSPMFAPRALYLPSLGVSWLVLAYTSQLPERRWHQIMVVVPIILVLITGATSIHLLSRHWQSDLHLFQRVLAADPARVTSHLQLATLYEAARLPGPQELHLRRAIEVAITADEKLKATEALAVFHGMHGENDAAERLYRSLAQTHPRRSSIWVGLGNIAWARRDPKLALQHYLRAVQLDPANREAAANLEMANRALQQNQP